jgi:hypothetical protein
MIVNHHQAVDAYSNQYPLNDGIGTDWRKISAVGDATLILIRPSRARELTIESAICLLYTLDADAVDGGGADFARAAQSPVFNYQREAKRRGYIIRPNNSRLHV